MKIKEKLYEYIGISIGNEEMKMYVFKYKNIFQLKSSQP